MSGGTLWRSGDWRPRVAEHAVIAVDNVIDLIAGKTPDILAGIDPGRKAFTSVKNSASLLALNPPQCWVTPVTQQFEDEGQSRSSRCNLRVTMAVSAGEPEALMAAALDYVRAVDRAIARATRADLDEAVKRIWIVEHDYGPMFAKDGGFSRLPQIHLVVEMEELD